MLLRSHTCTTKDWERVIGKLLWFAMLNRPLLACTNSIFQTGNTSQPTLPTTTTPSNRQELRTLTALLPLSRVDVQLPICHIIVAFDASKLGGAVTYAYAHGDIAEKLWEAAQTARSSRNAENHVQLPEVSEVIKRCQWQLAFVHYWRQEEHINCLEVETAVFAVRERPSFKEEACVLLFFVSDVRPHGEGLSSEAAVWGYRCVAFFSLLSQKPVLPLP